MTGFDSTKSQTIDIEAAFGRADESNLVTVLPEAPVLKFFVDGKPQAWQRPVTVKAKKTGRMVTFTPRSTADYEKTVRTHALRAARVYGWPKPSPMDRYHVDVSLYFADDKPRDIDNCLKTILDALKPVVYTDDFLVASCAVERVSCSGRPGVHVRVSRRTETRGLTFRESASGNIAPQRGDPDDGLLETSGAAGRLAGGDA